MTIQWLLGWWNLIFLLPLGLALLYVGVYAVSGLTFGDADADASADGDLDADADVHADIHADADVHAEADADADVDADADAGADADHAHIDHSYGGHGGHGSAGRTPLFEILSIVIGLGRAPLSILLMVLFLTWGMLGFFANTYWFENVRPSALDVFTRSAPIALVGSILLTRLLAGAMGRYLPTSESYATRRHELLGCVGEAIFNIDAESGMASVRDANHDLFHVQCRIDASHPPIPKGSRVKLVAYNGRLQLYQVALQEPATAR